MTDDNSNDDSDDELDHFSTLFLFCEQPLTNREPYTYKDNTKKILGKGLSEKSFVCIFSKPLKDSPLTFLKTFLAYFLRNLV